MISGTHHRQCRSAPTTLLVLVVTLNLIVAASVDEDTAGPFQSRGRASGNLVGGYLAAIERQRRRFTDTQADTLLRRLGDDFNAELMSINKPPPNVTRAVSE